MLHRMVEPSPSSPDAHRAEAAVVARPGPSWVILAGAAVVVGVGCGVSAAVFLRGLDVATSTRLAWPWLPWLLPAAAALLLVTVDRLAGNAPSATALALMRATTGRGPRVPRRWWLLALLGTWWTHLWGGSAGREGTALQLGSVVAEEVVARGRRSAGFRGEHERLLLVAGLAGGFGAVFGTPLAGCVFAVELTRARAPDWGSVPRTLAFAAIASFTGDAAGDLLLHALGGSHGFWPTLDEKGMTPRLLGASAALGLSAGVVAVVFLMLTAGVRAVARRFSPARRGVVVGALLVLLWRLSGSDEALGLSLPALGRALAGEPSATFLIAKIALTAVTVGGGLIGGEVTPLFVVGATLGATLAGPLQLSPVVAAVAGMGAVYGGAAGTPWALAVMCAELCGPGAVVPALVAVVVATVIVRRSGRALYERPAP
jgi:H+/Cl- antiporter ClcA